MSEMKGELSAGMIIGLLLAAVIFLAPVVYGCLQGGCEAVEFPEIEYSKSNWR